MRTVEQQLQRLHRIEPLLRCPLCGGKLIRQGDDAYQSEGCGTRYAIEHGVAILLPPTLTAQGLGKPLPSDQRASTHPYSPAAEELIAGLERGLVLDLGAGGKHTEHPHVLQVDVFRFPMVDVVASADCLPFRGDAFDAVISQAVFEHLQYPEAAAAEVWRVLKPDGVARIDTAFLQPEHAYPHHYFNATEAGLRHWFRDFELQWSGVEPFQHPKWALNFFLWEFFLGLFDRDRLVLEGLTLKECVDTLSRLSRGQATTDDLRISRHMDALVPEAVRKLAAGVSVSAIKRLSMPIVQRSVPTTGGTLALELERRLQANNERLAEHEEYKKNIAEISIIQSDRARFLLHEYDLNRQDLLLASGFTKPFLYLVMRELRHRLPPLLWNGLRRQYRTVVPRASGEEIHPMISPSAVVFCVRPQTPVALLDLFFSLCRQTHGDWVLMLESAPAHDATIKRLMWELQQRDKRVIVATSQTIAHQVALSASVRLPDDAMLAVVAVEELITLRQRLPHARHITADVERWYGLGLSSLRCWASELDVACLYQPDAPMVMHVPSSLPPESAAQGTGLDSGPLLKVTAHIPKVLYRLMAVASV